MAQRRHHYERAFEAHLRERRIPYVAVDEAKKALLPQVAPGRLFAGEHGPAAAALKSFDFVLYGRGVNLLAEVKGRRIPPARPRRTDRLLFAPPPRPRLESWATRDDVDSLRRWEALFGGGFEAVFVFVYWCDEQPPDALFEDVFAHEGRWYACRAVRVGAYAACMKTRSERWGTVDLPARAFDRLSQPLCGAAGVSPGEGPWGWGFGDALPAMDALADAV